MKIADVSDHVYYGGMFTCNTLMWVLAHQGWSPPESLSKSPQVSAPGNLPYFSVAWVQQVSLVCQAAQASTEGYLLSSALPGGPGW